MRLKLPSLLLLLFVSAVSAYGQEVLVQDPVLPQPVPAARTLPPAPLRVTGGAPFPFFDDFSGDSLKPDPAKWLLNGLHTRTPGVSAFKGHHPPTQGVATFDGASFYGKMYQNTLGSGFNDSLITLPIDLSTRTAADSLYLSFFLQPGGRGEAPEVQDSFCVYFDTSGTGDWERVMSIKAGGLDRDTFLLYRIPLLKSVYFHSAFRFCFTTWGSLNGELDQWHLDMVYLDANRTYQDGTRDDQSPVALLSPMLGSFTALPLQQFRSKPWMTSHWVEVSNRDAVTQSASLTTRLRSTASLTGTTQYSALSATPGAQAFDTVTVPAFSDQSSLNAAFSMIWEAITPPGDLLPANDTLRFTYRVDTLMAYDDGVSDNAYGLTTPRSFAQEFRVNTRDTLTAIWIHFAPTLYYNSTINQSTNMENYAFKLMVWDEKHPDSLLYLQSSGTNVVYTDTGGNYVLNGFHRYRLGTPQRIDSVFWVGIEQVDGKPIGVGFDTNFDNSSKIFFENSSNVFQQSTQKGTLMIRPEFGRTTPVVSRAEPQAILLRAWPNPVQAGSALHLSLPEGLHQVHLRLTDLQGRILLEQAFTGAALEIPACAAGLYLLEMTAEQNGRPVRSHTQMQILR